MLRKHTYFYSFTYTNENGDRVFGDGYFTTKADKHYIYCEIREYMNNKYPKSTILSISRID